MTEKLGKGDASALPEMHAILSGLKTLATTATVADIETARRSMGGHGFSAFSGLGNLYANTLPSATYVLSSPLKKLHTYHMLGMKVITSFWTSK